MSAAMQTEADSVDADIDRLMAQVQQLLDGGRVKVARPVLAALRRIAPPSPRLWELGVRLLMQEGQLDQARTDLEEALRQAPGAPALRLLRADLRMRADDVAGAAADAAEAVLLDQSSLVAKATLGVALIELGRVSDAVACLSEAVTADPGQPLYRLALAQAQERCGYRAAAGVTLSQGIILAPLDMRLRLAACLMHLRAGAFERAEAIAAAARRAGVANAALLRLHGSMLVHFGQPAAAENAFHEARKLAPEDADIARLAAASASPGEAARTDAAYVASVFDDFAPYCEAYEIDQAYRVPGLVRRALLECRGAPDSSRMVGPVLDLGCGTGLVGIALSDLPFGPLTGVDLSAGMLAQAHVKRIYADLRHEDLETTLADAARGWRVIVAADVLCHFGALDATFAAVRARLTADGVFVCSLEEWQDDADTAESHGVGGGEWHIGRTGHYSHRQDYVRRAAIAAGLVPLVLRREALRFDAGEPVEGLLLVCERRDDE